MAHKSKPARTPAPVAPSLRSVSEQAEAIAADLAADLEVADAAHCAAVAAATDKARKALLSLYGIGSA